MQTNTAMLNEILDNNPHAVAAWFNDPHDPTDLTVITTDNSEASSLNLPLLARKMRLRRGQSTPINILRAYPTSGPALNQQQECQNEPIKLGTQIQPSGANWVGTAGAPVSFTDTHSNRCWGILSNWHVLADGDERLGRTAHQPDTARTAIANLTRWSSVSPTEENLVDCAVADSLTNGRHTIANEILEIGRPSYSILNATIGLNVKKCGRTTGLTFGHCIGTDAAISVGYEDFTARFTSQDVFAADSDTFSAPGDSGSLILGAGCNCPTALLFAGSDTLTIGNPMRLVAQAMSLIFPFN